MWPAKGAYKKIYLRRLQILKDIRSDKSGRTLAAHLKYYKTHNIEFIETWFNTYDPRIPNPTIPFLLFPIQKDYIKFLDNLVTDKEPGLVEKARDGGYTWCSCAWATHRWLFYPGTAVGIGSRKEDLVDRIGVADSIIEKVRILIRGLPFELRPDGYNERKHAGFMKILHPSNGSTIVGEAGDNIGRGGRTTIYFKDEAAHYNQPEKIEASLSENTDVQVDISSVNGEGNVFHKRRFSGAVRVFVHSWRDDPRKDQAWYDKKKAKAIAEGLEHIFAQEVDRDYSASVKGVFIPAKWVQAAVNFRKDEAQGGVRQVGLDPDDEGTDGKALVYREGITVKTVKFWHAGDTTETAREAWSFCLDQKADILCYDAPGVGAGIKGELNSLVRENGEKFHIQGVFTSSTDIPGFYEDSERLNSEMFTNIRSLNMWKLRRRFEKTYNTVNGIKEYPLEECISLLDDKDLISEISRPKKMLDGKSKIIAEAKKAMKNRGIPSPNRLDALCLAFHDTNMGLYFKGADLS